MKRPKTVMSLGAAFILLAAFVVLPGILLADASDCINACADQWAEDKANCDEVLADRLTELAADAEQCAEDNPNDPLAYAACLMSVNVQVENARREHVNCMSMANTQAYDCYRDCQVSADAP